MDKINDILRRDPGEACTGCDKAAAFHESGLMCPVFKDPSKIFAIRVFGICPFNAPETIMTPKDKQKVRVGQQKHGGKH